MTIKTINTTASADVHAVSIPITFDGTTITIPAATFTLVKTTYSLPADTYVIPSPAPDLLRIYIVLHNGLPQYFVDAPAHGDPHFIFNRSGPYTALMLLVSANNAELAQGIINVHHLIEPTPVPLV